MYSDAFAWMPRSWQDYDLDLRSNPAHLCIYESLRENMKSFCTPKLMKDDLKRCNAEQNKNNTTQYSKHAAEPTAYFNMQNCVRQGRLGNVLGKENPHSH
jgi:hypothetical protein